MMRSMTESVSPRGVRRPVARALCAAGLAISAAAAAAAPADAQTRAAAPAVSSTATAQQAPTINDTLLAVRQIALELKAVDERLGVLDKSVSGMNASLSSVAVAAQPAQIKETLNLAGDIAWERGRALILLGTACIAGLMLLHALLRRWYGGHRSSRL